MAQNVSPSRRSVPMPVKYWSFAGLMLTNWCNARCDSCYECCGPQLHRRMSTESALNCWQQLRDASPHSCRIHLTGGEVFGDWPALMELVMGAQAAGLSGQYKIETNAFWAVDRSVVARRLGELDAAGMGVLCISADPYHQQFVPIAHCRLLAEIGREVLGPHRVQVRWEDWLAEGFDTGAMPARKRQEVFTRYFARGRERLAGRAAQTLSGGLPLMNAGHFADKACNGVLLRGRHVHVCPDGEVMPGTCAGIALGTAGRRTIAELWQDLDETWQDRQIVGVLAREGPCGLLALARAEGFDGPEAYASKCHLCWTVRRFLSAAGKYPDELGPAWVYQADAASGSSLS